jgi:hypothetical protein
MRLDEERARSTNRSSYVIIIDLSVYLTLTPGRIQQEKKSGQAPAAIGTSIYD